MKKLLYVLLFVTSCACAKPDPASTTVKAESDAFFAELNTEHDLVNRHPPLLKKLIKDHLVPLIDEEYMARQVLGDNWKRASFSQRQAFLDTFRNKVLETYADAFAAYYGYGVTFSPAEYSDNRKKALVKGTINAEEGDVPINFRMYKTRNRWKAYDIQFNDISLIRSYREQVARNIQQQGLAQAISILAKEYQDQTPVIEFGAVSWDPYMAPGLPNQGLAVDIVTEAFAELGYRTKANFMSGPSIEDKTDEGSLAGDIAAWRREGQDDEYFYSAPYLSNRLVFAKRDNDPFTFQSPEQMSGFIKGKGYRLGLYSDVDYGSSINQQLDGFVIDHRDYCSQLIRDVGNKSLDLALLDQWAGAIQLQQKPALAEHVTLLDNAVGERLLRMRIKRSTKDAETILDAFNTGLERIKANGKYAALLKLHKYPQ